MVIAIGIVAALAVYISNKSASRRMCRVEKQGLAAYAQKARSVDAFPFDYLSW
jgi:hypothetical protein